jgi:heme exporter protein D
MQFQFDSVQAFFDMGGYGFYIWLCYGFVFVVWAYLAFVPKWQTKTFIHQERRREQRRAALEEEGK